MLPTCTCCSDRLIRHIRQGSIYWWCHSCWAEMPNMEEVLGLSTHGEMLETPVSPQPPAPQPRLSPTLQEQMAPAKLPISIQRLSAHRVA